jgi:hypothetical protein
LLVHFQEYDFYFIKRHHQHPSLLTGIEFFSDVDLSHHHYKFEELVLKEYKPIEFSFSVEHVMFLPSRILTGATVEDTRGRPKYLTTLLRLNSSRRHGFHNKPSCFNVVSICLLTQQSCFFRGLSESVNVTWFWFMSVCECDNSRQKIIS